MTAAFTWASCALLLRLLLKWLPALTGMPTLLCACLTAALPTLLLCCHPVLRCRLSHREPARRPAAYTAALLPLVPAVAMLLSALTAPLSGGASLSPTPQAFVALVLLPPLSEELFYRFALLRLLRPYSEGGALLLSSLAFGLSHTPLQWPYAFAAGLILGYVTLTTRRLWPALLLHACNNLISFALLAFPAPSVYVGTLAALSAASALSLVLLWRTRLCKGTLSPLLKGNAALLRAALTSPLMPCFVLLLLLSLLTVF